MASLVLTDSYKQAIPSSPPQIRRGQGKWWMTSPLGCQGLLVLHWIVPQRPPSSSITNTPHLECDMNFLGCRWLFWKPSRSYSYIIFMGFFLFVCLCVCLFVFLFLLLFLIACYEMADASEEHHVKSAGTFPVSSRSQTNVLWSAWKQKLL